MSFEKLKPRISQLQSLWRGGGSQGPLVLKELQRASSALLTLQRGLTGTRTLASAAYMNDSALLGAYILYYWPISYLQVNAALTFEKPNLAAVRSARILDLGCGPGAASAALLDLLGRGNFDLTLADTSSKALKAATALLQNSRTNISTVIADLENSDLSFVQGKYRFILLSHVLNELWTGKEDFLNRRIALVKFLADHLEEGGFILLNEPALLLTSRNLMALRDGLIENGLSIASPCPSCGKCPSLLAGPEHTCHAEIPFVPFSPVSELAQGAHLKREAIKMSFFVVKPEKKEEKPVAKEGSFGALVVSEPMLNKAGRVRFLMCDGQKLFSFSAKKDDPMARGQKFFMLKRYDFIQVTGALKKEMSYQFTSSSRIRIISSL